MRFKFTERHQIEHAAALAAGHESFMASDPCSSGHVGRFNTRNNYCCACRAAWRIKNAEKMVEYRRRWRVSNLEKSRACTAEWAKNNPEKKKEKDRIWHQANKDRNNLRARKWQKDNVHRARATGKEWKSKNTDKVNAYSRNRRAVLRGVKGLHTADDIMELRRWQHNKCAYCRVSLANLGRREFHVDHIIPLIGGGDNARSNLQLLCSTCNLSKADKHPVEYARFIGRLI